MSIVTVLILGLLIGFLYARIRQNGYPIDSKTENKFVDDWVGGFMATFLSSFFIFIMSIVQACDGWMFLAKAVLVVVGTFLGAFVVIILVGSLLIYLGRYIPNLMRQGN